MTRDEILQVIKKATDTGQTILDLKKMDIEELPPEIGSLTSLEVLNMRNNRLWRLPPEIGLLQNLRQLSVIRNEITELPDEIGCLSNLQELYAGRNRIVNIPTTIGNLVHLRTLSLNHNMIEELPPEIGNLDGLYALLLSQNRLSTLPFEIVKLTSLRALELKKNLFEPPLDKIVLNGTYAIMSYLLGLHFGQGFEKISRHRVSIRKELRTALQQYLVYFADFVRHAKGKEIIFNVLTTTDGLELQVHADDAGEIQTIGNFFEEYISLIGQNLDKLHFTIDGELSETQKQILLVELRSQVRNLQSAVEIRNVRVEYLQSEVKFLRQLLTENVKHPQPIQIEVLNNAEMSTIAENIVTKKIGKLEYSNIVIKNYHDKREELDKLFCELKKSFGEYDTSIRDSLDKTTALLIQAIQEGNTSKFQNCWEQLKEGLKTGGAAATIVTSIARLLGIV